MPFVNSFWSIKRQDGIKNRKRIILGQECTTTTTTLSVTALVTVLERWV